MRTEHDVDTLINATSEGLKRAGDNNPLCCYLYCGKPIGFFLSEIGEYAQAGNEKAQKYLIGILLGSKNSNARQIAYEILSDIEYLKAGAKLYWKYLNTKNKIVSFFRRFWSS